MEPYGKKSHPQNKARVNQRLQGNLRLSGAKDLILSTDYNTIDKGKVTENSKERKVLSFRRDTFPKSMDFDKFSLTNSKEKDQNVNTSSNLKSFQEIVRKSRNARYSMMQLPYKVFQTLNNNDTLSALEAFSKTKMKTKKMSLTKYPKISSDKTLITLSDVSNKTSLPISTENASTHDPISFSKPKNSKLTQNHATKKIPVSNLPAIMTKIKKSNHSESPVPRNIINIVNNVNPSKEKTIDLKMNINRYDIKYYVRGKSGDDYSDKVGTWLELVENETEGSKGPTNRSNTSTRISQPIKYIEINRANPKIPQKIDTTAEVGKSHSLNQKEKQASVIDENFIEVKKITGTGTGKQEKSLIKIIDTDNSACEKVETRKENENNIEKSEETNAIKPILEGKKKLLSFNRMKTEYAINVKKNHFPKPYVPKTLTLNLKFKSNLHANNTEEPCVKIKDISQGNTVEQLITSSTVNNIPCEDHVNDEVNVNITNFDNHKDLENLNSKINSEINFQGPQVQFYDTQCENKTATFNHGSSSRVESKMIEEEPDINTSFHKMLKEIECGSSVSPQQSEVVKTVKSGTFASIGSLKPENLINETENEGDNNNIRKIENFDKEYEYQKSSYHTAASRILAEKEESRPIDDELEFDIYEVNKKRNLDEEEIIEMDIKEKVKKILLQIINDFDEKVNGFPESYTILESVKEKHKKSFHSSSSDHKSDIPLKPTTLFTPSRSIRSANVDGNFHKTWTHCQSNRCHSIFRKSFDEQNFSRLGTSERKNSQSYIDHIKKFERMSDMKCFKVDTKRKGYKRTILIKSLIYIQGKFDQELDSSCEKSSRRESMETIVTQLAKQIFEIHMSSTSKDRNVNLMQNGLNNGSPPSVAMNVNINAYLNKHYFDFFEEMLKQVIDKDPKNEDNDGNAIRNCKSVVDNFKINANILHSRMTLADNAIFKQWIFHDSRNLSNKNQVFISKISLRDIMNMFVLDEKDEEHPYVVTKRFSNPKQFSKHNYFTQSTAIRISDEIKKLKKCSIIDENEKFYEHLPVKQKSCTNTSLICESEYQDETPRPKDSHSLPKMQSFIKKNFLDENKKKKKDELQKRKDALKEFNTLKISSFLQLRSGKKRDEIGAMSHRFTAAPLGKDLLHRLSKRQSVVSWCTPMSKENTLLRTMEIKTSQSILLQENILESLIFFIKDKNEKRFLEYFEQKMVQVDINAQDEEGNSLLNLAVQSSCYEIARFLLVRGCDPDLQNNLLNTPLHYALSTNNFQIANLLLKYQANEDLPNKDGLSPWESIGKKLSKI